MLFLNEDHFTRSEHYIVVYITLCLLESSRHILHLVHFAIPTAVVPIQLMLKQLRWKGFVNAASGIRRSLSLTENALYLCILPFLAPFSAMIPGPKK